MSQVSSSVDWLPKLTETDGPLYLAFVQALESDVQSGVLKPGTRLLPQRDMASQLSLSVGTISRAYAEAEARGLISGEVGRGTFVQRRRLPASTFIRRHRAHIRRLVARWTGENQLTLDAVLDDMISRCRELDLRAVGSERKLVTDFIILLTAKTMHALFGPSRRKWIAL